MKSIIFACLIFSNLCFAQQMELKQISRSGKTNNSAVYIYELSVFNSTTEPLCLPVSGEFEGILKEDTTLMMYSIEKDSSYYFSLEITEGNPGNIAPKYPFILNPRTSFVVKLKFVVPNNERPLYLGVPFFKIIGVDECTFYKKYQKGEKWLEDQKVLTKRLRL